MTTTDNRATDEMVEAAFATYQRWDNQTPGQRDCGPKAMLRYALEAALFVAPQSNDSDAERFRTCLATTTGKLLIAHGRIAKLEAANAEMLEELQDMVCRFSTCAKHTGSDDEFIAAATESARAAISKATGAE